MVIMGESAHFKSTQPIPKWQSSKVVKITLNAKAELVIAFDACTVE
jgi:hypothetical protein